MATALIVKTQFTALDKITFVVKKMSAAVKGFANKAVIAFNRVERAEKKLRDGLSKTVGKFGLVIGFTALAMVAGNVVSVFADFEQANAGLAAVMGKTVAQNKLLIADAKRLGSITAKTATEVVGLQEAFARLGFEEPAILSMTEATINGAIAMKSELADTAELVGAMVKSFDAFEAVNAPDIIDQMTLATQKSALNFEKLQTALPIVSGAANAAGIPFTKLLALLGKLSDAGIDASSSSTALRNIFLESAAQGLSYDQILKKIVKSQDKLTIANDQFGKRGAVSSVILAKNLEATKELDQVLKKAGGTAETAANKQLATLTGRLTLLGSAWEGFILSIEDGSGSFGTFLKTTVDVASEILALASGTAKAESKLNKAQKTIRKIANTAMGFLKVIKWVVIGMIAFKTVMIATNILMAAYKIGVVAVTAAQWLWNAAMSANPISLIVIAIAALIAIIVLLVQNWQKIVEWVKTSDNVFAKLLRAAIFPLVKTFNQLKTIITFIVEGFSNLVVWLKESDNIFAKLARGRINYIINAFKTLGNVIMWIGGLFETMNKWLDKITDFSVNLVGSGLMKLINAFSEATQNELGVNTSTGNNLNPDAKIEQIRTERIEKTNNSKVGIEINDKSGLASIVKNTGIDVNLTRTLGWQQ